MRARDLRARRAFAGALATATVAVLAVSVSGSARATLGRAPLVGIAGQPAWSPDGRRILFTRFDADRPRLYVIGTRGGEAAAVTNGYSATWSPSGAFIAFLRTDPPYGGGCIDWCGPDHRPPRTDFVVARADGSSERMLFPVGPLYDEPTWSPDGKSLAFASSTSANADIYVADVETGAVRRVTDGPAQDTSPAWSPDGRRLVFTRSTPGPSGSDLVVVDADGTDAVRLTKSGAPDWSPSWSPDGKRIAFLRVPWVSTEPDVFVIGADGRRLRNVTSSEAAEGPPAWSPDGGRLLFNADTYRGTKMLVLRLAPRRLFRLGPGSQPVWSPGGNRIAFTDEAGTHAAVALVNPDGTGRRRLTPPAP